jgi:aspartyl-tRNA(Asn)/glutamyl-tRNA(Gln) amidotransferase subunit B
VRRLIANDFSEALHAGRPDRRTDRANRRVQARRKIRRSLAMYAADVNTVAVNLAGLPAISIPPASRDERRGLAGWTSIDRPGIRRGAFAGRSASIPTAHRLASAKAGGRRVNTPHSSHLTPHRSWQPVIGLEIHAQLNTASKLFSGASTAYGAEPNTHASVVDVALPGTLPVPNHAALDKAIRFGLAVNAQIARHSVFARKNYFYPDLPKGYQISQYELPIVANGPPARADGRWPRARRRDPARAPGRRRRQVAARCFPRRDWHRSQPRRHAAARDRFRAGAAFGGRGRRLHAHRAHARALARHLRRQHAGRLVPLRRQRSVRPLGDDKLGTRAEIKNVNSFRFVEKAIEYEIERQIRALEKARAIVQETRLYDAAHHARGRCAARKMRRLPLLSRPDLPPLMVTDADIAAIVTQMPELPDARRRAISRILVCRRRCRATVRDAPLPTTSRQALGALSSRARSPTRRMPDAATPSSPPTGCSVNWPPRLNDAGVPVEASRWSAPAWRNCLRGVATARSPARSPRTYSPRCGPAKAMPTRSSLRAACARFPTAARSAAAIDAIMAEFPKQLADYRAGNDKLLQFFVGQAMKAHQGSGESAAAQRATTHRRAGGEP